MRIYVFKRTSFAIITIFVAILLNFLLFRAAPGSAVTNIARVPGETSAVRQALRKEFGLDQSLWTQLWLYLKQLAHGNLGISFADRQPVSHDLAIALGNTAKLVIPAFVIGVGLGMALGIVAAWRRGSWLDRLATTFALGMYSLPSQWLGLMLITLFAGVLPAGGIQNYFLVHPTNGQQVADLAEHVLLPALTLAVGLFGLLATIMRSALLETLGEDYVLAARAKGMSNFAVIRRYGVPNALLPTITLLALAFGSLAGGSVLVEAVFSWPGMGLAMSQAVNQRDYPMLQGTFLMFTVCVILCNYIADLLYFRLDPRTRVA